MANILWIDNDRVFLNPFVSRLKRANHTPVHVRTVQEGEEYLNSPEKALGPAGGWHLVLIDVMMSVPPTAETCEAYSAEATRQGRRAGVVFYERNRARIAELGAVAAFPTMRGDDDIRQELIDLGVPHANIVYKMDLPDTREFLAWVEGLLAVRKGNE